jgi:hypothetical protein
LHAAAAAAAAAAILLPAQWACKQARPAACYPQLPTNEPWAHWAASHYNASLAPGNDCVLGARNDKYDYFTGNSTSTTGEHGTERRICSLCQMPQQGSSSLGAVHGPEHRQQMQALVAAASRHEPCLPGLPL